MKKRISLLIIGVMLCLCGCNTNTDVNAENTEQSGETEVQDDISDTQNDTIVNGPMSSSRISYSGSEYEWGNVTVIIPEEWDGKYILEETEDDLFFFQKTSKEKDETMGWLCTISVRDEYYNDMPGTTLIAYSQAGVFIIFLYLQMSLFLQKMKQLHPNI